MAKTPYDRGFFEGLRPGSVTSAKEIVPRLIDLIHPQTVVDVGCGIGAWLSVFRERGIQDVLGVDGSYVDRDLLMIPPEQFQPADLEQPLELGRKFDLVTSLEVGEHVAPNAAKTYVGNLVKLGPVIVFSAAIPLQGGDHHVNEQWPDYWKALFDAHGYIMIDCFRPDFWNHTNVELWYRQNMFLIVKEDHLRNSPVLMKEYQKHQGAILSMVHPVTFLTPSLSRLMRMFPPALGRAIKRRLPGPFSKTE